MPVESKPLPQLAISANALLNQLFVQQQQPMAEQALSVMGLAPSDGWKVDFSRGIAVREVVALPESESHDGVPCNSL
jgi:hypothetical protein